MGRTTFPAVRANRGRPPFYDTRLLSILVCSLSRAQTAEICIGLAVVESEGRVANFRQMVSLRVMNLFDEVRVLTDALRTKRRLSTPNIVQSGSGDSSAV